MKGLLIPAEFLPRFCHFQSSWLFTGQASSEIAKQNGCGVRTAMALLRAYQAASCRPWPLYFKKERKIICCILLVNGAYQSKQILNCISYLCSSHASTPKWFEKPLVEHRFTVVHLSVSATPVATNMEHMHVCRPGQACVCGVDISKMGSAYKCNICNI